jgi:putative oxidoreductase
MLDRLRFSAPSARDNGSLFSPRPGSVMSDALLLIARILMGYIFVLGGWGKLTGLAGFAAYLEGNGVPGSYGLAVVAAAVEFLGGLALVLGVAMRYAAWALVVFVVIATGIAHRFWEFDEAARRAQAINFNKNMAMMGGLLALVVAGPGRFSLDGLLARPKP